MSSTVIQEADRLTTAYGRQSEELARAGAEGERMRGLIVDDPEAVVRGHLLARQLRSDGTQIVVPRSKAVLVAPALAVEVVRPLRGDDLTPTELRASLGAVRGVLRIHDDGPDDTAALIEDNLRTHAVVVGSGTLDVTRRPWLVGCVLYAAGRVIGSAASAAGGDPAVVAERLTTSVGGVIQPGSLLVLAPLLAPAVIAAETTVRARFGGIGPVTATISTTEEA